jgi:hypothetical protein
LFEALSRRDVMAEEIRIAFRSPVGKLARFFEQSRNRWKTKYGELKRTCKLLDNQTRAVEKSRESWRLRATTAEERVAQLEREIERLKLSRRGASH